MRRAVAVAQVAGVVVTVGMVAGCGSGGQSPEQIRRSLNAEAHSAVPRSPTPAAPTGPYDFDGHGADVSAARFGKKWPLTVKSGRVNCIPLRAGMAAVFTTNDRRYYWLNDVARSRRAALDVKDPSAIRLPGHDRGLSLLEHICDTASK